MYDGLGLAEVDDEEQLVHPASGEPRRTTGRPGKYRPVEESEEEKPEDGEPGAESEKVEGEKAGGEDKEEEPDKEGGKSGDD